MRDGRVQSARASIKRVIGDSPIPTKSTWSCRIGRSGTQLKCQTDESHSSAHRNDHLVPVEPVLLDLLLVALVQGLDSLEIVRRVEPLHSTIPLVRNWLSDAARSGRTLMRRTPKGSSSRPRGLKVQQSRISPTLTRQQIASQIVMPMWGDAQALLTTSRTSRAESGRSPRSTKGVLLDRAGLATYLPAPQCQSA